MSDLACRETTSLSVEEQLVQVQKQLQQLSQLPSAIQATLDAVSKQLANIVSNGSSQQQTEESTVVSNENDVIEPITANEGIKYLHIYHLNLHKPILLDLRRFVIGRRRRGSQV